MKRLVALLLTLPLLCGCRADTALRGEIVVTALGIHHKDGAYALSVQAIDGLKTASGLSEQSEAATAVYEAAGDSVSAALHAFLNEAGRHAYILHNQIVAVSTAQCEAQSLFDSLDYLIRNGEGRTSVLTAVCRGDPADLLGISSGNDAIPARYVVGLLEEGAAWGVCAKRDLLDVERAYSGMYDATLPILTVADGTPVPDGTALFRDGVFAGELTGEQTTGLLLLGDELRQLLHTADGVTYTLNAFKTTLTVHADGQRFRYRFSLTGRVSVAERQNGAEPSLAAVERYVKACMEDALRVLDETDCDPLALARQAATANPSVTQETARSQLKTCDKTVSVTLKF